MTGSGLRIGLVLGAGGVSGHAFHCGVLAGLEDHLGVDVSEAEVVVGTSAGALVGVLLRLGLSGADLADRSCGRPPAERVRALVERIGPPDTALRRPEGPVRWRPASPTGLVAMARRPWGTRVVGVAAALLPEGRASTESISAGVRRVLPDWPDGFIVPVVALDTGRRVLFDGSDPDGPDPATAVAASCAIPGWFAPVAHDGRRYVDGGSWSPTNADVLARRPGYEGLDLVVVSSPMSSAVPASVRRRDAPARVLHHAYLRAELLALRRAGVRAISFEPGPEVLAHMGSSRLSPERRAEVTVVTRATVVSRLAELDVVVAPVSPRARPASAPGRA